MKWNEKQYTSSLASTAGNSFLRTATRIVNIAAVLAISPIGMESRVTVMDAEYRTQLEQYLTSMLQAKKLLSLGVISSQDYAKIDTIIAEKHGISSCSIYRGIDLLYSNEGGNMSHYEEVTICRE